jgi:hypothetical protein
MQLSGLWMLSKDTTVYFPANKALVDSNRDTNIALFIMSVLSHSLWNNSLTDKSIPHLTELIESAKNLEILDLQ